MLCWIGGGGGSYGTHCSTGQFLTNPKKCSGSDVMTAGCTAGFFLREFSIKVKGVLDGKTRGRKALRGDGPVKADHRCIKLWNNTGRLAALLFSFRSLPFIFRDHSNTSFCISNV